MQPNNPRRRCSVLPPTRTLSFAGVFLYSVTNVLTSSATPDMAARAGAASVLLWVGKAVELILCRAGCCLAAVPAAGPWAAGTPA